MRWLLRLRVDFRGSADAVTHLSEVNDKMHGLLMDRADALMGCVDYARRLVS
jgi:hypothetical protein